MSSFLEIMLVLTLFFGMSAVISIAVIAFLFWMDERWKK